MEISEAKKLVKEKLPEKRYNHSLRVAETAVKLAEIYDGDKDKAELAGVLHDYCKYDDLSSMYQIVRQCELETYLVMEVKSYMDLFALQSWNMIITLKMKRFY